MGAYKEKETPQLSCNTRVAVKPFNPNKITLITQLSLRWVFETIRQDIVFKPSNQKKVEKNSMKLIEKMAKSVEIFQQSDGKKDNLCKWDVF